MTAASRPRVAIALPAFRAVLERGGETGSSAARLPETQWLASRGRRMATSPDDWRAWLLSQFGPGAAALKSCPAGVSARSLATGRREDGSWACADPVHLLTGLDHLRLAPLAGLRLTPAEVLALEPA